VVGKFKKLPGGSIMLIGKKWKLVGLVMAPAFFFCHILPKILLNPEISSPAYRAFALIDAVLVLVTLAFILWTPRRIVVFDTQLGGITITHAGLLKERESIRVSASDIQELSLVSEDENDPYSKPRLFLKTRNQLVYLVSLGRSLLGANLFGELQSLVAGWKSKSSDQE